MTRVFYGWFLRRRLVDFWQCVNEKNNEAPPVVEYVSERIIGQGIDINTDSGFLPCCNCTDNCQVILMIYQWFLMINWFILDRSLATTKPSIFVDEVMKWVLHNQSSNRSNQSIVNQSIKSITEISLSRHRWYIIHQWFN